LKEIRRASARGELTDRGLAIAETFHLLEEALRSGVAVEAVVYSERVRERMWNMAMFAEGRLPADCRVVETPDAVFNSLAATESPQGVLALVRMEPAPWDRLFRFPALTVVLDGIQDPGNAGTIARAAEAFHASGLAFLKGTVSPCHPKTLRAAAGSLFRVPFVDGVAPADLLAEVERHGASRWIALPRDGAPLATAQLTSVPLDEPCALIIGNEGRGVSAAMAAGAQALTIPTSGVESLNAAMAASIILYEAFRQRMEA
jgi:TrmH family RNA methyltransferase